MNRPDTEQRLTDIEAAMSRVRARLDKLESIKPIMLTVEVHADDSDVEIEAAIERAKAEKGIERPTHIVLLNRFARDRLSLICDRDRDDD